jgi:hypothetical protein
MLGCIFRMVLGFALACLAAGLTLVLFVYTPVELAGVAGARFGEAALLTLAAATQAAMFSAPLAFVALVFAEWQRLRSPAYYALAGVAIAALGFWAQYRSEAAGDLSILNTYALSAFALTGMVGGLSYWLCAGRRRDGAQKAQTPDTPLPPAAAAGEGSAAAQLRKA